MKTASVVELKNRLSEFLSYVENGEEVEVRKRNIPVARVVPIFQPKMNQTKLGSARGTGKIVGEITGPQMSETDWCMLSDGPTGS